MAVSRAPTISPSSLRGTARSSSRPSRPSERVPTPSPKRRSGFCKIVRLDRELAPDRGVVRGAVLGARLLVDVACRDPVCRMRREQQMIDAQPLVAVPPPRLVIPEGVAVRLAVKHAVGVGQPEIDERAKQ